MVSSKTTVLSIYGLRNDKKTPPPLTELAESSSTTIIIFTITIFTNTITTLPQHYHNNIL
jgi:hypothetical protein